MNDPERLAEIVRKLHGVETTHVRSEPVHEQFQGETIWQGIVEVFTVRGHPTATTAYAWTYEDDDGKLHHLAVLGVPPVDSAQDAVKAAVVAHIKKQEGQQS